MHHIHIWSIDGYNNYATMHVITDGNNKDIKKLVKEELKEHRIQHTTIELEEVDEKCEDDECNINLENIEVHHHHHHNH